MLNPFDDSNQNSIDEHDTSLPICFGDHTVSELNPSSSSQLSSPSPIAIIDLDRLSEKLSNADASQTDMRSHLKQAHQMMKQLKVYTECLQNRNLEMALQLQRERMRNKQIINTLTFLKQDIEERNATEEERQNNETVNYSNYVLQKNRGDMLESEAKSLKLENTYLKELILIANDNYEKLELKNREILQSYYQLEQQKNRNQIDMVKKTEEIKNMFATIVIEKNQHDRIDNRQNKREEPHLINNNSPLNFTSTKSTRKEPVEDAYRQLFLKTLKPKKENRPIC